MVLQKWVHSYLLYLRYEITSHFIEKLTVRAIFFCRKNVAKVVDILMKDLKHKLLFCWVCYVYPLAALIHLFVLYLISCHAMNI